MNGGQVNENLSKMSNHNSVGNGNDNGNRRWEQTHSQTPKLIFQCQLAEGSHTAQVSGFSSIKELYERIGENFNIPASDVSYLALVLELCHPLPPIR